MVPQLHKQSGPTSQSCSTAPHSSTSAHRTVFLTAFSLARKSGRARECLAVVSNNTLQLAAECRRAPADGRERGGGPKLMILDEPSMGLAPILMREIFERSRTPNPQESRCWWWSRTRVWHFRSSAKVPSWRVGESLSNGSAEIPRANVAIKEFYLA